MKKMKNAFFNDDHTPSCALCARCRPAPTENEMLCMIRGVVSADQVCKRFRYDPFKREPREVVLSADLSPEDMKL